MRLIGIPIVLLVYVLVFSSCNFDNLTLCTKTEVDKIEIDKSLAIKTIWESDMESTPSSVKFFEKYFVIYTSPGIYEVYSNETGKKIISFNYKDFPTSNLYESNIVEDYFCFYYSSYGHSVVKRLNLVTMKSDSTQLPIKALDFLFDKEFFYFYDDNFIVKGEYNSSKLDTIYSFNFSGYPSGLTLGKYKYPKSFDEEHLIVVYQINPDSYKYIYISIIDIISKRLIDNKTLLADNNLSFFNIEDHIVNIGAGNLKYSYDLRSKDYFYLLTTSKSNKVFCVLSENYERYYSRYPIMFVNNGGLTAYDFYSGTEKWNSKSFASAMHPLYLIDEKASPYNYIAFSDSEVFNLANVESGVIKFQNSLKTSDNMPDEIIDFSSFYEGESILVSKHKAIKIKISKK